MSEAIYVVDADGHLTPASRTPYRLEDDLQQLVADHPELLPGDQIDPENPRRWRLIRREAGVGPSPASGRWSLDHLFVDQDAIPTLVEAKRGGNPEARREVVAQLLEYAANGTLYWPVALLQSWFEDQYEDQAAAVRSLARLQGVEDEEEWLDAYTAFWVLVGTNLRDRKIRLIFVADEIPPELKTLVEFLNEQMSGVEVLAVEVVQYAGKGQQLLAPRLVGQTSAAVAAKATRRKAAWRDSPWTEGEILDLLEAVSPAAREMGETVLAWVHARPDLVVEGNRGLTYSGLHVRLRLPGAKSLLLFVIYGRAPQFLEIHFGTITACEPFRDEAERTALHNQLQPLTRMAKQDAVYERYAYVAADGNEDRLRMVLAILGQSIDRIRTSAQRADGSAP